MFSCPLLYDKKNCEKEECPSKEKCKVTGFTTYTQGGWGSPPSGNNPGKILQNGFPTVYPLGVSIGKNPNFYVLFQTSNNVMNFFTTRWTFEYIRAKLCESVIYVCWDDRRAVTCP